MELNNVKECSVSETEVVVIGGMVLDINGVPSIVANARTTTPGKVLYALGGVARNIAECMSKLGVKPFMISALGIDFAGIQVNQDIETAVICNIFDDKGELAAGVASAEAIEKFVTPDWIRSFSFRIESSPMLVIDANLSPAALVESCGVAAQCRTPVWFEPVSVLKSRRIASIAKHVTFTSPNEDELISMANALSSEDKHLQIPLLSKSTTSIESLFLLLKPAIWVLLEKGIRVVVVTLGPNGVFLCFNALHGAKPSHFTKSSLPSSFSRKLHNSINLTCPRGLIPGLHKPKGDHYIAIHFPALPASVIRLTGAGDCLVGGTVVRHESIEQLLLLGRMLLETTKLPWNFSRHPAATGTFFTVMLFGLKFCSCQTQGNLQNFKSGLQLLEDRIYRAALGFFAYQPEWYDMNNNNFAQSESQSVSIFLNHLLNERSDNPVLDQKARVTENGTAANDVKVQNHPVWGQMENYAVGREKRRQLLIMLCQHEADRLDVWAQPVGSKEHSSRLKITSEKWVEFARTAFSVDPRIALALAARFPANSALKSEVSQLVQTHILELRSIPEALPYFVTPKAVDENSTLLQQLPHWAACSITQALEFLSPAYKGHPRVMAYILRVLESYPPERVTFFMPQLVQSLRYDEGKLVEGYLLRAAQRSDIFAHILIWHLQGETCVPESGKDAAPATSNSFQEMLPAVRQRIIDSFTPKALDLFNQEFDFFDKVTSISGVLYPIPKEERRAGIRRELEKIQVEGDYLYLPTAPNKFVRGIQVDSGIPLQSAAKVPIMITFNVVDRDGDPQDVKPQACIFKVGDDCRQDVLALQVISLLKDIFEAVGLSLYLFPYGVLPTGPEKGIIEVVPNARSRSQMGETNDGGLYEIFQQDFGPVGSPSFEAARENFLKSSAGYAVASLLLQPKDRHNGNLLFDNAGRLVHIDFGFILETSPGGNMRFESAHFKLSHEMTQLLDPSGVMKSDTWYQFVSLCVKGYLSARRYMDGILTTVALMIDSGLPCFSRGDPIGNLRKRFHPEMSEREAANFMIRICTDAYNKWTTAGYDLIQYLQQGIEK